MSDLNIVSDYLKSLSILRLTTPKPVCFCLAKPSKGRTEYAFLDDKINGKTTFFFFWPCPHHAEVPMPGSDLRHSSDNARSVNH